MIKKSLLFLLLLLLVIPNFSYATMGLTDQQSQKLAWATVARYVDYMLQMDIEGMKSLATGELLSTLNQMPQQSSQQSLEVKTTYKPVTVSGNSATTMVHLYNPKAGSLNNRLVFSFELVRVNMRWKISNVTIGPDKEIEEQ